jgi:hypothetical protein
VERRRRDGWNGAGAERTPRAADGSPTRMRFPIFTPRRAHGERSATGVGRGVPPLAFLFGCVIDFLETGRKSGFSHFARVGVSRFDNAFKSYYRSGKYLFARERPLKFEATIGES